MRLKRFLIRGGLIAGLVLVGLLLLTLVSTTTSHPRFRFSWMISETALSQLMGAGLSTTQVQAYFGSSSDYLLESGTSNSPLSSGMLSIRVKSYTSYAALASAFAANAIDPSVQAILYDNERWEFTPEEEQVQPGYYEQQAAQLIHAHHLRFIAAPATDLVAILAEHMAPGSAYEAYLQLGIAADAARYADVFVIQSQGSEANASQFQNFVQQASIQARAANNHVIILAGLSTNPSGHQVTPDELYQAVKLTQDELKNRAAFAFQISEVSFMCTSELALTSYRQTQFGCAVRLTSGFEFHAAAICESSNSGTRWGFPSLHISSPDNTFSTSRNLLHSNRTNSLVNVLSD